MELHGDQRESMQFHRHPSRRLRRRHIEHEQSAMQNRTRREPSPTGTAVEGGHAEETDTEEAEKEEAEANQMRTCARNEACFMVQGSQWAR